MSSAVDRLNKIYDCIENIEFILNTNDVKITTAIEDKLIKPAIRMKYS